MRGDKQIGMEDEFLVLMDKRAGSDDVDIQVDASSPAAACHGVARLIQEISEAGQIPVEHIIGVVTSVLLGKE